MYCFLFYFAEFNSFQASVEFHVETSHLIYTANLHYESNDWLLCKMQYSAEIG